MAREKQQLLQGADGLYVGRILKSGELSKDAYKISEKEIVAMFEHYLREYCKRNKTNVLMVYRGGVMAYEALLHEADGTFKRENE